jgi:uncharacterized surface protein with fasciclin (FAS1) repeats
MYLTVTGSLVLASATAFGFALRSSEPHSSCTASAATAHQPAQGKGIVETAISAGNFQTLVKALKAAKLVEALEGEGPFTVFAPSDEAFGKLPAGTLERLLEPENAQELSTILTYHVVAGDVRAEKVVGLKSAAALNGQRIPVVSGKDGVSVAGARVVKTDLVCTNGVIHVVDRVMMPATKDVVATAVDAGKFSILAKALGAAGLVEALSGKGPFTVFAPTDEAFGKLPPETLASLLEPANKAQLVGILKYHVVAGRVYADQLETSSVLTLGGVELPIEVGPAGPKIGAAGVLKADVEASNGVIHVIERVLIPEA